MWTDILLLQIEIYMKRLSSMDNIADLPSRPESDNLQFMKDIGASETQPFLPAAYSLKETWEALHERLHAIGW